MMLTKFTFVCLVVATTIAHAETATLRMRFLFGGVPPQPEQFAIRPGVVPGGGSVTDESLLVDRETRGIQNVLLFVYTGRAGTKLEGTLQKNVKRQLVLHNGRYSPHILLAQAGDTLELLNRDQVLHDMDISFLKNPPRNATVPQGKSLLVPLSLSEPGVVPLFHNTFPWMKAYVVVLEHEFAAVSNKNGQLEIQGLPTDKDLLFRVWHESGRVQQVTIDGQEEHWKRSRFEIRLKAGLNDLGDIVIPADALSR